MRYHYEKPNIYLSMYGQLYICDHPIYDSCTLFEINDKGLAVIQQRFDSATKSTWWSEVDSWLTDDLYLHADNARRVNERLQQDIQRANDRYAQELERRTRQLVNTWGLFDAVRERDTVSGTDLLGNLQGQVNEFRDWQAQLDQLAGRGVNQALIEYLREKGPAARAEIEALNSLTNTELASYVRLWQEKYTLASNQATRELEGLRRETQIEIQELERESRRELENYRRMFNEEMQTLRRDTNAEIARMTREWAETIGTVRPPTEVEFRKLAKNVNQIIQDSEWEALGGYMVDGLKQGVRNTGGQLVSEIGQLAQNTIDVVRKVLGIHSPSRVFENFGEMMDKGWIRGIVRLGKSVVDATKDIGHDVIDVMKKAILIVNDIVNSDMDIQPTIRPVLDLDNVYGGLNHIDGAFKAKRGMSLGVTASIGNQNGTMFEKCLNRISDENAKTNSVLVSAIDSLDQKFDMLVNKLGSMGVVLDSGALVGAIAPGMDSALGGISNLNGRGVI